MTFLEAAACERDVLSCRLPAYIGTFAEQFFHFVSPDKPAELAQAMVQFVNREIGATPRRLRELRELVCREYDEQIMAARLLDIYRRLLTEGQSFSADRIALRA